MSTVMLEIGFLLQGLWLDVFSNAWNRFVISGSMYYRYIPFCVWSFSLQAWANNRNFPHAGDQLVGTLNCHFTHVFNFKIVLPLHICKFYPVISFTHILSHKGSRPHSSIHYIKLYRILCFHIPSNFNLYVFNNYVTSINWCIL